MKFLLTILFPFMTVSVLAQCPGTSPALFSVNDAGSPGCDANTWKHEQAVTTSGSPAGSCLVLAGTTCDLSWYSTKYSLNCSFCVNFSFTLSTLTSDGIAFSFVDLNPRGAAYPCSTPLGCLEGGNLGYNALTTAATGTNGGGALTIEFDVFNNSASGDADPSCGGSTDHISLVEDGNNNTCVGGTCTSGSTQACTSPLNMDDGASHTVNICWDPSINRLTVRVDGTTYITYNSNIRSLFANPSSVNFAISSGYNASFLGNNTLCNLTVTGTLDAKDLGFAGKLKNNKIELSWKSKDKNDKAKYDILKSTDNVNYEVIKTLFTSPDRKNYSYTDQTPQHGLNYYKLREQVLQSGEVTESEQIVINNNEKANIAYLNKKEFNIDLGETIGYTVKIQNLLGQCVYENSSVGASTLNLSGITNGVYILSIIAENDYFLTNKIYLAD